MRVSAVYTPPRFLLVGEWRRGIMRGWGVAKRPDGRRYVGEWRDNFEHGFGVCTFPDGSVYRGHWRRGRRWGRGEMTFADENAAAAACLLDQTSGQSVNQSNLRSIRSIRSINQSINRSNRSAAAAAAVAASTSGVKHRGVKDDGVYAPRASLSGRADVDRSLSDRSLSQRGSSRSVERSVTDVNVGGPAASKARETTTSSTPTRAPRRSWYRGDWAADRFHGAGEHQCANGDRYEGHFSRSGTSVVWELYRAL